MSLHIANEVNVEVPGGEMTNHQDNPTSIEEGEVITTPQPVSTETGVIASEPDCQSESEGHPQTHTITPEETSTTQQDHAHHDQHTVEESSTNEISSILEKASKCNSDADEADPDKPKTPLETEVQAKQSHGLDYSYSQIKNTMPKSTNHPSPSLTCNEKLDPERDGNFQEVLESSSISSWSPDASSSENLQIVEPVSELNTNDSPNEKELANDTLQIATIPSNVTNTTYTYNQATYTTTATLVDPQASLGMNTVAGSIPASLTAAAPLFNKNTAYTWKALNCNASSSPVVSGVSTSSKKNNIPAGSIYLPAQATAGEMKLPNSSKSVPMVMVPVPDGRTLMAIPMSSLNNSDFTTQANKFHPNSMDFLKNNPQLKTQLQGHNLNLSGTLLTIQIPSTVTGTAVVSTSINTSITNTTSLTGYKSSVTAPSNPTKAATIEPYIPTPTSASVTATNPPIKEGVSTARVPQRNSQPSQNLTSANTSKPQDQSTDKPLLDEQAKKLLRWSNGVGTLEGCDFKFTLNEFGDLEVLDTDDEEENEDLVSQLNNNKFQDQSKRKHEPYTNGVTEKGKKKPRHDMNFKPTCPPRKVLPGSSLLSGGPDDKLRRTKPLACIKSKSPQPLKSLSDVSSNINTNWQHLIEKLMPQDRISQFKIEDVDSWKPDAVKKFVDSIAGCAGNGCLFEYQQICGQSLMLMNQRDLVDILNIKLGPAVKIYHAILLVKEQSAMDQTRILS